MLVRGGIVLAVVTGGIALGAVLGHAADPEMKMLPGTQWHGALQAPAADDAGYQLVDQGAADVNPYQDSYAPSWANEELADWTPHYPSWTYGNFASDLTTEIDSDFGTDLEDDPNWPPEEAAPSETEVVAPPDASAQQGGPALLAPEARVADNLGPLY